MRNLLGYIRYLQEHLAEEISLSVLAEQLGYGFMKVFKKSEGITPSQYGRDFLDADKNEGEDR